MGQIINFKKAVAARKTQLESLATIECPKCDEMCSPLKLDAEGSVHYSCSGPGHRKFHWRIAEDGTALAGKVGNRELTL